jgi:hypothetical protein
MAIRLKTSGHITNTKQVSKSKQLVKEFMMAMGWKLHQEKLQLHTRNFFLILLLQLEGRNYNKT